MKARGTILLTLALLTLTGLLLVSSTDIVLKEKQTTVYGLSVLIPDENDDCWGNFKKGMERAAVEFNADVSFVSLYERSRAEQQAELMLREIENGAQALIICPADSEYLASYLDKNGVALPIITLDSRVAASQIKAHIGADRYNMGEKLASAIRQDSRALGITEVIAVSVPGARHDIDETFKGLKDGLTGSGIPVRRRYALFEEEAVDLLEEFRPEQGQVLAALDVSATQMLATQVRRLEQSRQALYGVGGTNNIIRGLEEGAIRAVAACNDYDAGYLSVRTAVEILGRTENVRDYILGDSLIRSGNIYDKNNEMLLFPIF